MTIHELKPAAENSELAQDALELVSKIRSGEVTGFVCFTIGPEKMNMYTGGELQPYMLYGYAMKTMPKLCELGA